MDFTELPLPALRAQDVEAHPRHLIRPDLVVDILVMARLADAQLSRRQEPTTARASGVAALPVSGGERVYAPALTPEVREESEVPKPIGCSRPLGDRSRQEIAFMELSRKGTLQRDFGEVVAHDSSYHSLSCESFWNQGNRKLSGVRARCRRSPHFSASATPLMKRSPLTSRYV